jgi:predicted RNA-binding Zn ribbon-like protein
LASIVSHGLVIPIALAGHPALDFCNTRTGWGLPSPKEYLAGHAHLTVWAASIGLIPDGERPALVALAARRPEQAAAVVVRAVALRSALYALLVGDPTAENWDLVDAEVSASAAVTHLRPVPGVPLARWTVDPSAGLELPLFAVSRQVAELLVTPAAGKVRACPGVGCGWLFRDPRNRRRWCSMAMCGNRAKVRRHAERHRP